MAGQSITFDFIGRGGPALAADFKRTGDNAAAAARGAKVLQDAIANLGSKENRTAAESANLARALRLTGDAEDRAAAKALAAEIAISRLDESMAKSSKDTGSARAGFLGLASEVTGFGAAADAAASGGNKFQLALAGLNLASGILEPALAGVVVAAGGLAAGFAAAGVGLGAFGIVAKSVYAQASSAATAYAAAQQKYASATTSKQRATALQAEKAAYAGLAPPVKTLAVELGNVQAMWKSFTNAAAPGVVGVLSQGIGILTDHFGILGKFLPPVEQALSGILAKLDKGLSSSGFTSFISALAANTGPAITKIAVAIGNVIVGIGGILKAFLPTSQTMLSGIDKITAKFREWGTTLSSHSGFQSLMATFRTETPQAVAILKNLGTVLLNVGKAMFGLSTFSNSKLLLQALLPLSGVLASLSKNTGLDRIALYLYAASAAAGKLKPAMTALFGVDGEGGIIRGAKTAVTAIGNMTKAMLGLDAAANANVIGLIVIAIAALAIGFTVAWKKSAAFRDVIKEIGVVMLAAAIIVVKANKLIVDAFLAMVGSVLKAAADAFGWVPGLGSKLRTASKDFDSFKSGVDGAFNGIIKTMQGWQGELNASRQTSAQATAAIVKNFQGQGAAARQGRTDMANYTTALQANTAKTDTGRAARARLITDLERSGLSARDANRLVDNLAAAVGRLHGKTFGITVDANGYVNVNGYKISAGAYFSPHAAGGFISGGVPGRDSVPAMLMPGEVVVPTPMVRSGAVDHLKGRLPGFAGGGQVGGNAGANITAFPGKAVGTIESDAIWATGQVASAATKAFAAYAKKQIAAAAGGIGNYKPGAGVAQWRGVVQQALKLAGVNVAQLTDPVLYQMQTESGGNPRAVNRSDINWQEGHPSVGLMQVIRGTFDTYAGRYRNTGPFAYGVSENPLANIYAAIKYAQANYGPGLRNAYGGIGTGRGYDKGGLLMPGLTMAWNGTGRPEQVIPPPRSGSGAAIQLEVTGSGSGTFDAFLLKWIQEHVRVRGGGDVQTAFGRR